MVIEAVETHTRTGFVELDLAAVSGAPALRADGRMLVIGERFTPCCDGGFRGGVCWLERGWPLATGR